MSDTKHGWVTPRADGARARCGGPSICSTCQTEQMHETMLSGLFGAPASKLDAPRPSWLDGGEDAVALAREDGSLPADPCPTCNDQGAVGNILTAEPCPDCSPSSPASTVATEGEKTAIDWRAVSARIAEYAEDYELRGEDDHGREGSYTPNETERGLIIDAIHGLLADDEFMALIRPAAPAAGDAQRVYHFEQRSRFGPWIEVEKPTEKSVEFIKRSDAPSAGDALDAARNRFNLIECMTIARRGFDLWAAKPHNHRWFKKIDGTPIPNDLPVCIADEFKEAIDAAIAQQSQRKES